jgi:FAD/FMN-containing dehydrogenase
MLTCLALGNGNTVGVLPYVFGGGTSILAGVTGYACDQILAARIVTAKGDIINVSAEHEADIFWATKGAGHFFGFVL